MKYFLIMLLLAGNVHAEVYKSINAAGEVVYSDTRTEGAEAIKLPELPTYTPPPVPPPATTASTKAPVDQQAYQSLVIVKPENEATVRNNLGVIMVALQLTPALSSTSDHSIQFYLDGDAYGDPGSALHATLSNVDRGEHSLSAAVLDADGETLIRTDPIIVHLHRETIYNPNNPNNPNRPKPTPAPRVRPITR